MIIKKETLFNGEKLVLETGLWAPRANSSVVLKYRKNVILVTTSIDETEGKEPKSFLPLTVDVVEKFYAVGRVPGGFFKREGKPSVDAALMARVIDRSIRPLFDKKFGFNIHLVVNILSYDDTIDPAVLGVLGASVSLLISELPFYNPIAAINMGIEDGSYTTYPTKDMNLMIAGNSDNISVIEAVANEVSEEKIVDGIAFGQKALEPLISIQKELANEINREKIVVDDQTEESDLSTFVSSIKEFLNSGEGEIDLFVKKAISSHISTVEADKEMKVKADCESAVKRVFREYIIENSRRLDGRSLDEVREIGIYSDILPNAHGSVLFTRGKTQSIGTATLGTTNDEQIVSSLKKEYKKSFFLHYNFPPFSVGESSYMRAPGRREIGHGNLAERALSMVMPNRDKFPYTVRVVSDIISSDGSSSMASVCSATLSLMLAGVPISNAVSGIAMGMIKREDDIAILTDISALEDSIGDMDFKVAGTERGITALQMDIKISGVDKSLILRALLAAKVGRGHILNKMIEVISEPKRDLPSSVPRHSIVNVDKGMISSLIGPAGKNIKKIIEETGANIDIDDSGAVNIFAPDRESISKTVKMIQYYTSVPKISDRFDAVVKKIIPAGLFVALTANKDGFVHISELSKIYNRRIDDITKYVKEGDMFKVVVEEIDARGKIKVLLAKGSDAS